MKKFFLTLFLLLLMFWGIWVYGENNASTNHNSQAELIHSYILDLKWKILLFKKQYKIEKDEILENEIEKLSTMILALERIKKKNIKIEKKKRALSLILEELKQSKNKITSILLIKKRNFEKELLTKKNAFAILWKKLSSQLDDIIVRIYKTIEKNWISKQEQDIVSSLKKLYTISRDLNSFTSVRFESVEEMKQRFIENLKEIKKLLLIIKKIWITK